MKQLTGRIFLGNRDDTSFDLLDKYKIHAVACICETDLDAHLEGYVSRCVIQQRDDQPVRTKNLRWFLNFMTQEVVKKHRRVLIHCVAGKVRTPCFACAWLMACGFSWEDAEAIVSRRSEFPHGVGYPILRDSIVEYFSSAKQRVGPLDYGEEP